MAMFLGQITAVDAPEKNGWKKWRSGPVKWYHDASVHPRDAGKTCWGEDDVVIDVECMARAWEMGPD
jgi:hypothetical protein